MKNFMNTYHLYEKTCSSLSNVHKPRSEKKPLQSVHMIGILDPLERSSKTKRELDRVGSPYDFIEVCSILQHARRDRGEGKSKKEYSVSLYLSLKAGRCKTRLSSYFEAVRMCRSKSPSISKCAVKKQLQYLVR